MSGPDLLAALDAPTPTVVALGAVVVLLVALEPWLGHRQHRSFLDRLAADTSAAAQDEVRVRAYHRWSLQGWAWALGALALVAALPGVGLADLGLRAPDLDGLISGESDGPSEATVAGFLVGVVLAVVASSVLLRIVARRSGRLPLAGAAAVGPMIPTTARARRGWAALALSAGLTEEVTYRGLLLLTLTLALPSTPPSTVLVVAAILFGLAHVYQGPVGMLATGAMGWVLGGLYVTTGSLVLPMVLHVLVDLRPLLLTPPAGAAVHTPGLPDPTTTRTS